METVLGKGGMQNGKFHLWLAALPPDSLERLRLINLSTTSSTHIILSLAFGIYDRNIRKLNGIITALLLSRMKAQRAGRNCLVERINNFMAEIHEAVDQITGTAASVQHSGSVCNRFSSRSSGGKQAWSSN